MEEILKILKGANAQEPTHESYNGSHVTILFIDGEMISTKGGELFGKRSDHCLEGEVLDYAEALLNVPSEVLDCFTGTHSGYRCLFIHDHEGVVTKQYRDYLKSFTGE